MTTIKFVHTADWQLGMRRHFLDDDALPRYMQARIDAIKTIGELAAVQGCAFVMCCGDVFDSNQLDRRTVVRALEAMGTIACPVYLLPGNHDPYDAGSIYRSSVFTNGKPENVHVLDSSEPVTVAPGVELVGVPWFSKSARRDLVAEALSAVSSGLEPSESTLRVCAAHGIVDELSPSVDAADLISGALMRGAVEDGLVHYVGLGDRHSVSKLSDRIWYSGAPEATDYTEVDSGKALVVELSSDACRVTPHQVGRWRFARRALEFSCADDVEAAKRELGEMPDKATTIVKLTLKGALSLQSKAVLDSYLEQAADLFGALEIWDRHTDLVVLPDELDLDKLGLAGFARTTVEELQQQCERGDSESLRARDALGLLYRLVNGGQS